MTLYELLKFYEDERDINLRRQEWDVSLSIRCEESMFVEQCVKTASGKDFSCPWFPEFEDILADDWEKI